VRAIPVRMKATPTPEFLKHPAQYLEMGRHLIRNGRADKAMKLALSAIESGSDDGLLSAIGSEFLTRGIEGYHRSMLHDGPRNKVYANAIVALAPGRIVLDIGTGSGLLAMIAAQAGAKHVYACEADLRLAATAAEIIAANGFSDRITLFPTHSTELDRDRDLGGGVDLVVSEIFSSNLLGERVLPSLDDARQRLCLPNARFLPENASIRVALVEDWLDVPLEHRRPVNIVEGFDLSLLNRHLSKRWRMAPRPNDAHLRSKPSDLFTFDFSQSHAPSDQSHVNLHSTGGRITGVAQWIHFTTSTGNEYENAPAGNAGPHWTPLHYSRLEPIETAPGQVVTVSGWRNEDSLLVWSE
jgi:type III protein arginine methyltransferase